MSPLPVCHFVATVSRRNQHNLCLVDLTAEADDLMADIQQPAERVAALLERTATRIVFAESCTGGLVSAALTRVPGISTWHCGSAVVYQIATKHRWLGISEGLLDNPGPVSPEVAAEMAQRVLNNTPHADLAASVTGYLGPNAPDGQDGLVFLGIVGRDDEHPTVERHVLTADEIAAPEDLRIRRQAEATGLVLSAVERRLAAATDVPPRQS